MFTQILHICMKSNKKQPKINKNFLFAEVSSLLPLDHENAGRVIRKRRKDLGLRQSDLVDNMIKLHTIRKVEKGEVVNEDIYLHICNKLDLDIKQLSKSYDDEKEREEQLKFKLFAIEHDIDMAGPDKGLEELRKTEIDKNSPCFPHTSF